MALAVHILPIHPINQPSSPQHTRKRKQNGRLSYSREGDPVGPPRADICDLLLSTVRECLKDSDTRLTFEILSPGKVGGWLCVF